jgi:hypothetical protein
MSTKIEQLKALCNSGKFHHATYRDIGTLWEGLRVFPKEENGFNGFGWSRLFFGKDDPELVAAQDYLRSVNVGTHLGSFGNG